MLRFLFLWLCLGYHSLSAQTYSREKLRASFLRATEQKAALDSFLNILETLPKRSPAEESYLGICTGMCCQYDNGNWAKLRHVLKSKNHLNNAVEMDSKDPELRFLRVMFEHFLPSFLGFNKHLYDDMNVLFANPTFIDESPVLKKKVIEFLLFSKRCTPYQTKLLEQKLAEVTAKL